MKNRQKKERKSSAPNTVKKTKRKNKSDFSTMTVSDFLNSALDAESSDDQMDVDSDDTSTGDASLKVNGNEPKSEETVDGEKSDEAENSSDENASDEDENASDEDENASDEDENASDEDEISDEDNNDEVNAEENEVGDSEEKEDEAASEEEADLFDSHAHKKSLDKLRETDPEFYEFLAENDKKLLQFNVSDSEDDGEEEDQVHKPDENLEVASDESDFEAEDQEVGEKVVTLKLVKSVQEELQNKNTDLNMFRAIADDESRWIARNMFRSLDAVRCAVHMFHSALQRVAAPKDEDEKPTKYIVDGSSVFNAVVQMCVLELQPAIKHVLKLPATGKVHSQISKCKRWKKIKILLRMYLGDLLKFFGSVTSSHILAVLLKHLHQLAMFVPFFPKLKRPMLKRLIKLWGGGEETVRVVAFLCILKMVTSEQDVLLEQALKIMYLTYVRNCKFVSPSTLPSIQFMRRSLAEMFALDEAASYQYVFLYVRQLAIHLRNAITVHSKESIQAVYNWQFIQSLHLWTEVLGATAHRPHLQPLLYPLVQVIIGTIKLVPTAQYYPLRFHCVQMLIQLSKHTGTFIPVLPFCLEVLDGYNFNKQHKKMSMKPLDFRCILRLSKSQLQENGFKDTVVESIYQHILEYLANESHTICFPDLVVPTIIQLKKFVKECKSPNHSRKMKQVLEKIEENSRVIENERKDVTFVLSDRKSIDAWETNMKLNGTPLAKFYESWNKINIRQLAKKATNNEKLGEYNLPTLKKISKQKASDDGPVELFPSSDESDEDIASTLGSPPKKTKRGARGGKKKAKVAKTTEVVGMENIPDGEEDIVQDLRLSDLE